MLVLMTKASDDYWYEFKEISSLDDLSKEMEEYGGVVIKLNGYYNDLPYLEENLEYWEGFNKEDISKMLSAKYTVIIYDDYIE
jgi:hypothetical protein